MSVMMKRYATNLSSIDNSANEICAPSKKCPGYLSKKSSRWKTGENRIGFEASDLTSSECAP